MIGISRLPFPALVAAGLVLGGTALMPESAAASCGSYVTILDQTDGDQGARHDEPVAPAAPCRGPECSKAPTTPALPLTAPVSSSHGSEQLATQVDSIAAWSPAGGWDRSRPAVGSPIQLGSSIFHPPRAS